MVCMCASVHIVNNGIRNSLIGDSNLLVLLGTADINVAWQTQTSPQASIPREWEEGDWAQCSVLLTYWSCTSPVRENSEEEGCLNLLSTIRSRYSFLRKNQSYVNM